MPKQPLNQYVVRNAEWEKFATANEIAHFDPATRMIIRNSFNEGWRARKAAQYAAIGQLPKPRKLVENRDHAIDRYLSSSPIPNKD